MLARWWKYMQAARPTKWSLWTRRATRWRSLQSAPKIFGAQPRMILKTNHGPIRYPLVLRVQSLMPPAQPQAMTELSHLDASGRARMVDVSAKDDTERVAVA